MSAFGLPVTGRDAAPPPEEKRRFEPPAEGWSTVAIILAMLFVVGWAIDDARWAGFAAGGGSQTSFLPWAFVIGALVGLGFAKTRLSPLLAHLGAAIIGAAYLIYTISGVISTSPGIVDRLHALNASTATFYDDLFVQGIRSAETSIFLLIIGTIAFGTGVFAAFNVFRRHRPMPAVVVAGLVLLINVSVTIKFQYLFLVAFSLGAMLLLVRMNLMEQREGWLRRRIGDAGYVSGLFMRSGAVFVAITLVGALTLAATASSAPLARVWRNADDKLVQFGNELNRVIGGVSGPAKGPSGLFGRSQTIRGIWESKGNIVFRVATSDGKGYYWRGATYDYFDGTTWQQRDRAADGDRVAPGSPVLQSSQDFVAEDEADRTKVTATITAVEYNTRVALSPDSPFALDRQLDVFTAGDGGPFADMELVDDLREGDSFTVSALVRDEAIANGGITGNDLAAAGEDYPEWLDRYRVLPAGAVGPSVGRITDGIVAQLQAGERDTYHIANAIQTYLFSTGGFTYKANVLDMCGHEPIVDCFLREKRGYCEYFATAMAVMLREQSIPARVALGYLPGKKLLTTGEWEVDAGAAHEWVEVWFPGYGWMRFDPTPGNRENGQRPTTLVAGPPLASAPPGASSSPRPTRTPNRLEDDNGLTGGLTSPPPGGQNGPRTATDAAIVAVVLIGLALLLMVMLGVVARRRIRFIAAPDQAFRNVTRIASRFGYPPLPTQTAYEYAGTLAEVVPRVAPELQVVATAKVEATYAARPPIGEGLVALRAAYRRARTGLLRLAFRRKRRSGPRRIKGPRR